VGYAAPPAGRPAALDPADRALGAGVRRVDQVTTWWGVTDISIVIPGCRTGWIMAWVKPATSTSKARSSIQRCLRGIARRRPDGAEEESWPFVDKADPYSVV